MVLDCSGGIHLLFSLVSKSWVAQCHQKVVDSWEVNPSEPHQIRGPCRWTFYHSARHHHPKHHNFRAVGNPFFGFWSLIKLFASAALSLLEANDDFADDVSCGRLLVGLFCFEWLVEVEVLGL